MVDQFADAQKHEGEDESAKPNTVEDEQRISSQNVERTIVLLRQEIHGPWFAANITFLYGTGENISVGQSDKKVKADKSKRVG